MIVYLVRHGLSIANVAGLVTGTPTDELVEAGRQQAESLSKWVGEACIQPEAFFVSQWRRARQTALALFPNVSWIEDCRLGETDAGSAAELPLHQFLASWPDFHASPANNYPQGESHSELNRRVRAFWADLCASKLRSVCLVTHSGPISCILQQVLGVGMDRFPAFLPAHASLTVLEFENSGAGAAPGFRLKGFSLVPQLGKFVR